jgi:hypothetical protein
MRGQGVSMLGTGVAPALTRHRRERRGLVACNQNLQIKVSVDPGPAQ